MVFTKNALVFFFFLMIIVCEKSKGNVYMVGDSFGWTNVGHVDYKTWAATKTFRIGDIIAFQYNNSYDNVVQVSHKNFKSCNSTDAYETFDTGSDSFVISSTGHFYFICNFTGHCESGQKVDIRVPQRPQSPTPVPAPSPVPPTPLPNPPSTWPWPTPSSPAIESPASAPAPSKNIASTIYSSKFLMKNNFWISALVLSLLLFGIGY